MNPKQKFLIANRTLLKKATKSLRRNLLISKVRHIKKEKFDIKWTDKGMLLTNAILAVFTIFLFYEAYSGNQKVIDMYKSSHAAVPTLNGTFVWRDSYKNTTFWGPRRIQLQFNLFNYSPNVIEVKY